MKNVLTLVSLIFILFGCEGTEVEVANEKIKSHKFLEEMHGDKYYPSYLVEKGKYILLTLCKEIETEKPVSDEEVYLLTSAAIVKFNNLSVELENQGSDIDTVAKENIAMDIDFILRAYGYDLSFEQAYAQRDR